MAAILDPFLYIIGLVINIYFKIVIIEVILHWLIHFGIVSVTNKYAAKTMEVLEKVTHPVYKRIREKMPVVFSGFDFSPFVLMLALLFVNRLIYRLYLMTAPI